MLLILCEQIEGDFIMDKSFFFVFLGLLPRHVEVPKLGVKSELWLLAYTTAIAMRDPSCICNLHHSSWHHQIVNPLSEATDASQISFLLIHKGNSRQVI